MMEKTKLLWMSDSPFLSTGFRNQSVSLLSELVHRYGFEAHYLAANGFWGNVVHPGAVSNNTGMPFWIHGTDGSQYGSGCLQRTIKDLKPDLFGVLLDTFMLNPWFLNVDVTPAHSAFYFPSDGGGALPLGCEAVLRKVQVPIAMSKFAQRQAKEVHGIVSDYVPHAVYPDKFVRYDDDKRNALRRKWGLQDKFVVGCVARHQPRKMLDITLRAFGLFSKDKKNAVLLFHCDPNDVAASFNLPALVQRMGLQNRVLYTGTTSWKGWDDKDMGDVYNLMDAFMLLSTGEGFGIPTIEAMSSQIPVVFTDYTTTRELLVDDGLCGLPVKLAAEITGGYNVDRAIANVNDAAACLGELYNSDNERRNLGLAGRRKVEEFYSWDKTVPQWKRIFDRIMG